MKRIRQYEINHDAITKILAGFVLPARNHSTLLYARFREYPADMPHDIDIVIYAEEDYAEPNTSIRVLGHILGDAIPEGFKYFTSITHRETQTTVHIYTKPA